MEMPVSTRRRIIELMGVEGEVERLYAEVEADPGDDIFIAELEYDLDEDED